MAFVWLFIAMLVAGAGVPVSAILLAKLGLVEPFFVTAFGRRWEFDAWPLFVTKGRDTEVLTIGHFALVLPRQQSIAPTAAVTVLCAHMLVNQPVSFAVSIHSTSDSYNLTQGAFAVSNA